MHDARTEILQWVNEGVLPQERARDALQAAGVTPSATQWRDFLERLLTWLGVALIAAAAVYFVAANWRALGRGLEARLRYRVRNGFRLRDAILRGRPRC